MAEKSEPKYYVTESKEQTLQSDQMCMGESLSTTLDPLLVNRPGQSCPPTITPRTRNGGRASATPSPSTVQKSILSSNFSSISGGLRSEVGKKLKI
jgi:hypothetical protein